MQKYIACTSFSLNGWETYGQRFVDTFMKHWNTPLVVCSEDAIDASFPDNVDFCRLHNADGYQAFMAKWGGFKAAEGIELRKVGDSLQYMYNYRFQALKFASKVFALYDAYTTRKAEWLIWIDADVETTSDIDDEFLAKVCPETSVLSYLGRDEWDHSECGFVAYRIGHPVGAAFLEELHRMYASGEIFRLKEWHDSYIFDVVREKFKAWQPVFHNISEGVGGNHVWPHTVLGEVMVHAKGPQLKKEIYG